MVIHVTWLHSCLFTVVLRSANVQTHVPVPFTDQVYLTTIPCYLLSFTCHLACLSIIGDADSHCWIADAIGSSVPVLSGASSADVDGGFSFVHALSERRVAYPMGNRRCDAGVEMKLDAVDKPTAWYPVVTIRYFCLWDFWEVERVVPLIMFPSNFFMDSLGKENE